MTPCALILDSTAMVIADFPHPRSPTRVPHARPPPARIFTLPPHQSTMHIEFLTVDAHCPTQWQPLLLISNQFAFAAPVSPRRYVPYAPHCIAHTTIHNPNGMPSPSFPFSLALLDIMILLPCIVPRLNDKESGLRYWVYRCVRAMWET